MTLRRRNALLALGFLCSWAAPSGADAQQLESAPVTVNYAGIGPITWTPVPGIKTTLAVPHFSGGARVVCFDVAYKCDIEVHIRNIGYVAKSATELLAEVKEQFQNLSPAPPSGAAYRTAVTAQVVEATFEDLRPNAKYRFTTMALVLKGPAIFQVVAEGPDSATVATMVSIARDTKLGAMREIMANRFAQFVNVCNSRMPATKAANERALAASPFTDAVLLAFMRQRDTTMTLEKLRESRVQQLPQFLESYDELKPASRQTFCSDLPNTIAATEKELRAQ